MKNLNKVVLGAVAALAISPMTSMATSFDFSGANGGAEGLIGTSTTDGGITAYGYVLYGGLANLWVRNIPNDHGLGVCSEGETACENGGGDVNELDSVNSAEGIVLVNGNAGTSWQTLWVSSLDSNDGAAVGEHGRVYWGYSIDDLNAAILGGTNFFSFGYGDFGTSVEGDILSLAAASGFDRYATYLAFVTDTTYGLNNDYLVWRGTVPEPSTLGIFGLSLLGIGIARRRRA